MIEVAGLSKSFLDRRVVSDVTFNVGEGEILGFLGPNGAGKTTTMRMLTGFIPPSAGCIRIGGLELARKPLEVKRKIGYLPETVAPYPEMRVREYLRYRGDLQGISRAELRRNLPDVLERCLLEDVADQIVGNLSKGYRQRVGLASALIHRPPVLILDEPTVGLDPKQIIRIRSLIKELGRDHTVLLSTHILPEVELICDRVVIIDGGRIVASGEPETLRGQLAGGTTLNLEIAGPEVEVLETLSKIPGVRAIRGGRAGDGRMAVESEAGADVREAIFREVASRGWVLLEMTPEKLSLEDIFVRITTRDVAALPESPAAEAAAGGGPA